VAGSYLENLFPEMSVGFERTMEEFENDSSILLEFSYPLWGFNRGKIHEAKAGQKQRTVQLKALRQQVGLEVYTAFLETDLAKNQVRLHKKSLEEANELLRQITMGYEEGEMPFMTLLEHLKTVKEIRLSYLEALNTLNEQLAQLQMMVQDTPIPGGQHEK
jgi:outer membrane protein TolC